MTTADHDERSAMTPVDDLLTEKTLMDLATPAAYIDGAAAAEHGAVRILEHDEQHVTAEVEDWQILHTELFVRDGALAWSCTCGKAETQLCDHLVATALATWPGEAPDDAHAG
jgi:uncharacterized Zn finger protein